jgi:glycosyltransferase involved in cell wall biosynthesis
MLSFVIPAYNEELLLGRTLEALDAAARASGEPFEMIVVDDASTDRTAAIAAEHGARVVPVHYRQISRTRNAGARAAAGDILFFVDADTLVTPAAVAAALKAIRGSWLGLSAAEAPAVASQTPPQPPGAVGGGCTVRFDGKLPLYGHLLVWGLLPLYRLLGIAAGCCLFCTREAFEQVGGFDERLLAAEELSFSRALARVGRVAILRESVITSGRKLRTWSALEVLRVFARVAFRGRRAVEDRQGLDIWYGERRKDPEQLSPSPSGRGPG